MSTVKESFIGYLKNESKPNSGKPSSYAKAMEVLEDVFLQKVFHKKFQYGLS